MELARKLGLAIVASGLENEAQLELVRELGCDWADGDYIAEASPAIEVARLLAA